MKVNALNHTILALVMGAATCSAKTALPPNHIALELGASARLDSDLTWQRSSETVPDVALIKNVAEDVYEVVDVLRGDAAPGKKLTSSEYWLKRSDTHLVFGEPTLLGDIWECRTISLENTTADEARAVAKAAITIHKTAVPNSRRKALRAELESVTPERMVAWLAVFPEWLEEVQLWKGKPSPQITAKLRQLLEKELGTVDDEDLPPARAALKLFTTQDAPELPVELLLKCLDRERSLRKISATLLAKRTGEDRETAIARMRKVLRDSRRDSHCASIAEALASLGAKEAAPEIRGLLAKNQFTYEREAALVALSKLDRADAEARLLASLQKVRVFGPTYFLDMAESGKGNLDSPEIVPYLVEASNGLGLIEFGTTPIVHWLQSITGLDSKNMTTYKAWWTARYPEKKWPIIQVRRHDKLGNLEFVVE